MIAVLMHVYSGIRIGRLTWSQFHGLYERAFSLPATAVRPPSETGWIENSLDRADAEMSIRALDPAEEIPPT